MADTPAPDGGLEKILGLPGLFADIVRTPGALVAFGVGAATIVVMALWRRLPARARIVPGPLAAVLLATIVTAAFGLPVDRVDVSGLAGAIRPPSLADFGGLLDPGMLATVLALTLIASADSLFSAAAVDRMHDGSRTDYDKELVAQGAGNTVCGVLGALPMTAVIVRSAANVQAGAQYQGLPDPARRLAAGVRGGVARCARRHTARHARRGARLLGAAARAVPGPGRAVAQAAG